MSRISMWFGDGTRFSAWTSVRIVERFTDPVGAYDFTIADPRVNSDLYDEHMIRGEVVQIAANEQVIARPIINEVSHTVDAAGGFVRNIRCVSRLAVLTEAGAPPRLYRRSKTDIPLVPIIEELLKPFRFDGIEVDAAADVMAKSGKRIDGRASPITAKALKTRDLQVHDGETVYNWIARQITRLGVALRPTWRGNPMLCVPDYEQAAAYTILEGRTVSGEGTRALSLTARQTNKGQFSHVVVRGNPPKAKKQSGVVGSARAAIHTEPIAIAALSGAASVASYTSSRAILQDVFANLGQDWKYEVGPSGPVEATYHPEHPTYLSPTQPFKPKFVKDKRTRDVKRAKSFGKLVLGKAAERAFEVTATVPDWTAHSERLWCVDTICHLRSASLGIDADMWVAAVELTDNAGGAQAQLSLIPKGSLIIGDIPT